MVKHVLLADKLKSLAFNPYIQNWYGKIPKISPSKYSPPKLVTQKTGGAGLSVSINCYVLFFVWFIGVRSLLL